MPRFLLWNMDAGRDVDDERRPFGQLLAGLATARKVPIIFPWSSIWNCVLSIKGAFHEREQRSLARV
jgi:hypothetical protein